MTGKQPPTPAAPSPKKTRYHHGNLRESLLAAALQALESESRDSLSLRGLAKAVGVSATAVYSHFTDKVELLVDLRTLGFDMLSEHLAEALEREPEASGERQVMLLGYGYMHFANCHPNVFDLLFGWTPELDRIKDECIKAGINSECMLRAAVTRMFEQNGHPPNEYQAAVASFSAWSMVHGLTTLVKSGSIEGAVYCGHWPPGFSGQSPDTQKRVFEHLLSIQIEGLKASVTHIKP